MGTATTEIRDVTIAQLQAEAGDLMREHWDEVGSDVPRLSVDWDRYLMLEANDLLICKGAFVDGKLAGYSVGILGTHGHDTGAELLQNDAHFVGEEFRGSGASHELMLEVESSAASIDAVPVWSAPVGGRFEMILHGRNGYVRTHSVYQKRGV